MWNRVACGAALLAASGSVLAQTTSTYVGPSGGLWSEPTHWSPNGVPANDGGNTFNVILPANARVTFDLLSPTQISAASFESGSWIDLFDTSLEVLGVALLTNTHVESVGTGAAFLTNAPFVSGDNQSAKVRDGGLIQLGLSTYRWSSVGGGTIHLADGAGSLLDLSTVTLLDATGGDPYGGTTYTMQASNGGALDLSGVTTLRGASGFWDQSWLRFLAASGGTIDLSGAGEVVSGRTRFELAGGSIDLSSLTSVTASYTRFVVPAFETLDLPMLETCERTEFHIANDAAVNAPNLTDFTGSWVELTPSRVFNTPPLEQIDNAKLWMREGAALAVADTSYNWTNTGGGTIHWADGAGSLLDLSTVTLLDAAGGDPYGGTTYTMQASNGGTLDLSGVTTLRGASGYWNQSWLRFLAASGGAIDLSSTGEVVAGKTRFELAGGSIDLSSLTSVTASSTQFVVPIFETLDLPMLETCERTAFHIASGGAVNAPNLTDFTGSWVELTPSRIFNTPPLEQIDNGKLWMREGAALAVADTSYNWTNTGGGTIHWADGAGSLLDLSTVTLFDATGGDYLGNGATYAMEASNRGTLDLSGVTTLRGASGLWNQNWLRFRASSGGTINLGAANHLAGQFLMACENTGSRIVATGDLTLGVEGGTPAIAFGTGSTLSVAGSFAHAINAEASHASADGTLIMNGAGTQQLEVAGTDIGLPDGVIGDNFNWGALAVGQDEQETTVVLVDSINNGNRGAGGEAEMLYLSGFPTADGLSIRGGSTLVLNGIQLYAFVDNVWTDINSLFGPEDTRIPFDEGFIQLSLCEVDLNGDGDVNTQDFVAFLNAWASRDPLADWDNNGVIDTRDFVAYLNDWVAGCP